MTLIDWLNTEQAAEIVGELGVVGEADGLMEARRCRSATGKLTKIIRDIDSASRDAQ